MNIANGVLSVSIRFVYLSKVRKAEDDRLNAEQERSFLVGISVVEYIVVIDSTAQVIVCGIVQ